MRRSLRFLLLAVLMLLALPWVVFAQVMDAQAIEIGSTVEGELTEAAPTAAFTFEASRNQIITITLISEDFDTYLTLQDADGETLATDDDSAGNLDSEIGGFTIPSDGSYTILAQSYESAQGDGFAAGTFTLSLEETSATLLEYGSTVEGSLTNREPAITYNFQGNEGDTVLITMTGAEGLDSYLNLYRGADTTNLLISNDDGAGNLNSLIGPYTLAADGLYTVEATSFSREAAGDFTLTLELAEVTVLDFGESVEGRLGGGQSFLYYQFEASSGDIIDIMVADGARVGSSLVLTGPGGYQVGYSDSYSGSDPMINDLYLNETGLYTILVRVLDETSAGKVTVSLDQATLASIDEDSQEVSFSSAVTRNTLVFAGRAGESVTLTFTVTEGNNASPNITVLQDNTTVSYISSSDVTELVVTLEVPSRGSVLVQIDEYSYVDSTIEVSLKRN
jgi:hypothetical protein